jgi:hypothetical protein
MGSNGLLNRRLSTSDFLGIPSSFFVLIKYSNPVMYNDSSKQGLRRLPRRHPVHHSPASPLSSNATPTTTLYQASNNDTANNSMNHTLCPPFVALVMPFPQPALFVQNCLPQSGKGVDSEAAHHPIPLHSCLRSCACAMFPVSLHRFKPSDNACEKSSFAQRIPASNLLLSTFTTSISGPFGHRLLSFHLHRL